MYEIGLVQLLTSEQYMHLAGFCRDYCDWIGTGDLNHTCKGMTYCKYVKKVHAAGYPLKLASIWITPA